MSTISIRLNHDSLLWPAVDRDDEIKSYNHSWNGNTLKFGSGGIFIKCEIELSHEEQESMVRCLAKDSTSFVPHWQTLTVTLHRTVQRVEKEVWNIARTVDSSFRKSPKGIRLAPPKLPVGHINQSQAFPVMHWLFNDEEKTRLSPIFEGFADPVKQRYRNGIMIPFSVSFDQKQIYMKKEEVDEIFDQVDVAEDTPPFWTLYAIAWENFAKNKSNDSAILILGTSIETALKWCLKEQGNGISNFLIEKMQSPSLDQLYTCAKENTTYEFPDHFRGWLKQLVTARNFVAHKPRRMDIDVLQIARWFAVGEAILKALIKKESDKLVGYLVEPIGEHINEKFSPSTIGVVLRKENYNNTNEEKLHVMLDTGESYYFGENAFQKLSNKYQKFPDIV